MMKPRTAMLGRGQTYGLLLGVAIGTFLAGLGIPFVLGEPTTSPANVRATTPTTRSAAADPASAPEAASTDSAASAAPAAPLGGGSPASRRAGTTGGGAGPGAPGGGVAPDGSELTASARGVTAEAIKVGVLIADIGPLAEAYQVGDVEKYWRAFIDDLNARGGVQGRRVDAVYRNYDALDKEAMNAACRAMTKDEQVFLVLNSAGFYGTPVLCVTEENQTLYLAGDGSGEEWYARSGGRHFSIGQAKGRSLRNKAARLDALGWLDGKKLGVLYDQEPENEAAVENDLIPTLAALGHDDVNLQKLSADVGTAQSQIPVAVQQMCLDGVQEVLLPVGFPQATQFVTQAERQGCAFHYLLSDFALGATDFYTQLMPASFDGAIAITNTRVGEEKVGRPESAVDAGCRETYARMTEDPAFTRENPEYGAIMAPCAMVQLFEGAANAAGPNLTEAAYTGAVKSFTSFAIPFLGGGGFGADRPDAAQFVQTVQWELEPCRCWKPVDDFVPQPH
jgi:ABC-type branched-subunit amino acid transport system substrate-binding protein